MAVVNSGVPRNNGFEVDESRYLAGENDTACKAIAYTRIVRSDTRAQLTQR